MNYRTSRVVWPKIVLLFLAVYRAILPRDRHHQDTSPHVSERLLLSTLALFSFSPFLLNPFGSSFSPRFGIGASEGATPERRKISQKERSVEQAEQVEQVKQVERAGLATHRLVIGCRLTVLGGSVKPASNLMPGTLRLVPCCLNRTALNHPPRAA